MLLYTTSLLVVWQNCKKLKQLSDKYRLNLKERFLEDQELGESCRTLQENHGKALGTILCDLCCWMHGMFCPLSAGLEHGKCCCSGSQSRAQSLRVDNRQHEKRDYNFIQHWILNEELRPMFRPYPSPVVPCFSSWNPRFLLTKSEASWLPECGRPSFL